jgi:nicotinate-nucleotide adenylyltransferase
MKIGLFFGSFNPIHTGHLIISSYVTNFFADKVWFILSPLSPFKINSELLSVNERLLLIKSAIKNNNKFEFSDVELNLPLPSFTINTLTHLKKINPEHDYLLIMGSDNFLNIKDWKSSNRLLNEYEFLIYNRPGFIIDHNTLKSNVKIIDAPLINISSTEIRALIKAKKNIRYIVPDSVANLIKRGKFYL